MRKLKERYGPKILEQKYQEDFRKLYEEGGEKASNDQGFGMLLVLFMNQEPELFTQNLALTSIENLESDYFKCCRYFINVNLAIDINESLNSKNSES